MNRLRKIFFFFAFLIFAVSAASQPIVPDLQVNENTYNRWGQSNPRVTALDNDNYVVFWADARDRFNPAPWAQIFDNDGNPLDDNFRLEGTKSFLAARADSDGGFFVMGRNTINEIIIRQYNSMGSPVGDSVTVINGGEVAWGDSGRFMMVWMVGFYPDIWARHFAADGTPLTDEFKVNDDSNPNISQRYPSISANSSGEYIIAWQDRRVDLNYCDIYAQRYDKNADKIGSNFRVDNGPTGTGQTYAFAAINDSGETVITWLDSRGGPGLRARCYDRDGDPLGPDFRITDQSDTLGSGQWYDVAINDQGNFLVSWLNRGTETENIYAKYFNIDSTLITDNQTINEVEQEWFKDPPPDVAADKNGNFIITWVDNRVNEDGTSIYLQKFGNNGSLIGDNFHTTNEVPVIVWMDAQDPGMIVHDDGSFSIFWTRAEFNSTGDGILGQHYTTDGTANGSNFVVNDYEEDTAYNRSQAVMNENGTTLVSWADGRDGWAIYGQLFSGPAAVGNNFKMSDDSMVLGYDPPACTNNGNNFISVWQDRRHDAYDIYARLFDGDGVALDTSFKINDDEGYDWEPAVGVNDSGSILIAWSDKSHHEYWSIYARLYNLQGEPLGSNFKLSETTGSERTRYPMIFAADSGQFVVSWFDYYNSIYNYYAQKVAGNGTLIGANYQIPKIDAGVADDDGNFIAVWLQNGVIAQRYNSDGEIIGSSFRIASDDSDPHQSSPDVKLFNGRIYTTWIERDRYGIGSGNNVWANVLDWDNPVQTSISKNNYTPLDFSLNQNYPNPFNPTTIIKYELRITSDISLRIYNLLGQKVATLVDGKQSAGRFQVEWNASGFPSGIYYYQFVAGDYREVKKMILIK